MNELSIQRTKVTLSMDKLLVHSKRCQFIDVPSSESVIERLNELEQSLIESRDNLLEQLSLEEHQIEGVKVEVNKQISCCVLN